MTRAEMRAFLKAHPVCSVCPYHSSLIHNDLPYCWPHWMLARNPKGIAPLTAR